ncbi:MAG: M6 family metalloprotease domain-containing protein [Deltaproteobacteria bacterium]
MLRSAPALIFLLTASAAHAMPPRFEAGKAKDSIVNVKVRRITEVKPISTTAPPPAVALSGKHRLLVVLAETADSPWPERYTRARYERLVFGTSASSMREYYKENSYGAFDLVGEVVGPLRVPGRMTDYAYSQTGGDPRGVHKLIEAAMKQAARKTDLKAYDTHDVHGRPRKDGIVDHVMVIYAEKTGRFDGFSPIWPHRGSIQVDLPGGLRVASYTVMNHAARLGVYVHEFGHDLGLPDLYDRDYSSHGAGQWCTMASGSWAGDAERPLHFSAWAKARLGWIQPTVISRPVQNFAIPSASERSFALRIPIGSIDSPEYFLVENRRRVGFDTELPAEGLLVWHIDESKGDNDDERRKMVDVVEASRDQDLDRLDRTAAPKYLPDVFSGRGPAVLSDDTNPSARGNDGQPSQIRLSVLGPPESVMHVDVVRPTIFDPGGVPYTLMKDGYQYGRFSTVPLGAGSEVLMQLEATPGGYRAYALEAFIAGRPRQRGTVRLRLYADANGKPGKQLAETRVRVKLPDAGYTWARGRVGKGDKGLALDAHQTVWVSAISDGKVYAAMNPFSTTKRARFRRSVKKKLESEFNFRDQGRTPASDFVLRVSGFGYLDHVALPEPRASDSDVRVQLLVAADKVADDGKLEDALGTYARLLSEMEQEPRRYETWIPVVVNAMGVAAYRLGRYPEAIESFERALRRAEAASDAKNAADVYENIAEAAFAAKQHERTVTEAKRSLAINERLKRWDRTVENLYWMARAQIALDQRDAAKPNLATAKARAAKAFDAETQAWWNQRIDEALASGKKPEAPPVKAIEERGQGKKERRVDMDLLQFLNEDTKDAE